MAKVEPDAELVGGRCLAGSVDRVVEGEIDAASDRADGVQAGQEGTTDVHDTEAFPGIGVLEREILGGYEDVLPSIRPPEGQPPARVQLRRRTFRRPPALGETVLDSEERGNTVESHIRPARSAIRKVGPRCARVDVDPLGEEIAEEETPVDVERHVRSDEVIERVGVEVELLPAEGRAEADVGGELRAGRKRPKGPIEKAVGAHGRADLVASEIRNIEADAVRREVVQMMPVFRAGRMPPELGPKRGAPLDGLAGEVEASNEVRARHDVGPLNAHAEKRRRLGFGGGFVIVLLAFLLRGCRARLLVVEAGFPDPGKDGEGTEDDGGSAQSMQAMIRHATRDSSRLATPDQANGRVAGSGAAVYRALMLMRFLVIAMSLLPLPCRRPSPGTTGTSGAARRERHDVVSLSKETGCRKRPPVRPVPAAVTGPFRPAALRPLCPASRLLGAGGFPCRRT